MTRHRLHTYRCPKCGTTIQVRSTTAVLTCQASTYCASRGVLMELDEEEGDRD